MPKWAKSVGNWFGERVDDWKVGAGIIEDETKDAASYVNQKVIRPTIKKTVAVATSLKNKTSKALSSAKKGICNAAPEICAGVKSFAKNTFGAEYTMASEIGYSTDIFPLGSPIQISASQKGTEIIEKIGDSSKPISVYTRSVYDGDVTHNTAGLKINICGATANFSFGLRNIGATVSVTNNNNTYFGGLNASICDLDVSANGGTTTRITDTSSYTQAGKISVNAMLIVAAYCYMQGAPFEMPSSSPVPGY